jgi:predicted Zn-dependent protease with MMP-like domain
MTTSVGKPQLEAILDEAEQALDRGDPGTALTFCMQVLNELPKHPGALYLTAEAYRDLGELAQAEQLYRGVLAHNERHSPSWSALGAVLFDQLEFNAALRALQHAIRTDPENPEAYYWRAMLREQRDDFDGAARDYLRAYRLDPERFPKPVPMDEAMVEAVVVDALMSLHPSIQSYTHQVAILLDEVPDQETCMQFHPPAPPGEILGFFSGVPLTERTTDNAWSNLPSAIVLYRRNLERIAWDRQRLVEELRITVFHEIGHFLGLDEDDLEARGLD